MALYLNNLDLNGNQLQKAVVHPLGTAPSTAQEGQIYYDTGASAVYVNTSTTPSSPAWVSMAGDMTGITLTGGNGITATNTNSSGGAYSSTITLDISDSTLTTETAIAQADLFAFSDESVTNEPTKNITFSNLEDQIFSNINSASSDIAIAAGGAITVNTLNQSTTGSAGSVANALTVDNTTVKLSSGTTYNGSAALTISAKTASIADGGTALATADQIHTFVTGASTTGNAATVTTNANLTGHITSVGNTASLGSFTTAQLNAAISDGSINVDQTNVSGSAATVTGAAQSAITSVGTLTGLTVSGNITANGNIDGDNATNVNNINTITAKKIVMNTAGSNTSLKIGDQQSATVTLGKVASSGNSDATDVSVANNLSVGGGLTVDGAVTLKGDVVLETTTNTALKDKILLLNQGQTGPPASTDDFGLLFSRGHGTTLGGQAGKANMMIKWDESELQWQFIATDAVGTESGAVDDISGSGSEGEDVLGDSGFQHLRVGKMTSVTFHGNGGSLTSLNGSAITSGTVAATRVATLNQSTTGNAATATKISSITNSNIVQLAETQTLTNKTLTSPVLNTGVSGTAIKDEDDMTSNSATHLATQQSIKAYVDSQGSSSSNTGGRQAFVLGHDTSGVEGNTGSANGNNIFTITHGMGSSRNYGVEVIRNGNNSGGGETVIVDVTRPNDTTIVITFAAAVTALDYTALVCKY